MGRTHGTQWTKELILEKVLQAMEDLGLDRMPSLGEMDRYYGDSGLSNKISKSGGFYKYAKDHGLKIKESETLFGTGWEAKVAECIRKMGHVAELTSIKHPYDILVNNRVKVDVKASRIVYTRGYPYYTFNIEKKKQTCDIFVAVTLEDKVTANGFYVIPSSVTANQTQISLGPDSEKYRKYLNRWDYIEYLDGAFKHCENF